MKERDPSKYLQNLTGYAYPEAIATSESRRLRKWILRVEEVLPPSVDVEVDKLQHSAIDAIVTNYGEAGSCDSNLPVVRGHRGTNHHLVLEIEYPAQGSVVGDSDMIATWHVLGGVDDVWKIVEIEGIPAEHWFLLGRHRQQSSNQRDD